MLMSAEQYEGTRASLTAIETEAALLGALMMENRLVDRVADELTADMFVEPVHQRLYATIVAEVAQGRTANPPMLAPRFEHDPGLQELGGAGYLGRLTGNGAALIGTFDFARQIIELAKRRRIRAAAERMIESVESDHDQPVESLVDDMDAALVAALRRTETARSLTAAKAFDETLQEIEDEASGAAPAGLSVAGFDDWNALTGTMRRGEVVILAGRPSMGKTAVALSTALGSARAGNGTLFVSLEMSVRELMKRAIADLIFVWGESATFEQVKAGNFTSFDRRRLGDAREALEKWPLVLRQDAGLRLGRLALMIRREKRAMAGRGQELSVVFIDYLGLVKSDDRKAKRYEEVSEVSRTMKELARELDVAIVVLAQLNREVEKREDKRPQLSDLRDSGEIEQDADCVLFVYREQYYLERSEPDAHDKRRADWETSMGAARDKVELISAKVRNGRIGRRQCHFFGAHQAVRGSNFTFGPNL